VPIKLLIDTEHGLWGFDCSTENRSGNRPSVPAAMRGYPVAVMGMSKSRLRSSPRRKLSLDHIHTHCYTTTVTPPLTTSRREKTVIDVNVPPLCSHVDT
jgi:hypothetical protein